MKKISVIAESLLIIIVLQFVRELAEAYLSAFVPAENFYMRMVTMMLMIILAFVVVLYARLRKTPLSFFPEKFGKGYIIYTCIAALLFITTPSNFTQGFRSVMLLFYGSVVTPIYEELIFRGYLWNKFKSVTSKESHVYIWSVVLFTLWHLGYMMPQLLSGNLVPVLWKLAAGLGYGVVLGFIRIKTNNCYSTMLAHGILNIFMI